MRMVCVCAFFFFLKCSFALMLCTEFYIEGGKNAYASVFAEHSSLLPVQDMKIQSLFADFQHTSVSK